MMKLLRCWVAVLLVCGPAHASEDVWGRFVEEARASYGEAGAHAAAFLAEHRPSRDGAIDAGLLRENLALALRAREEFPWARSLSDELFFNDVLPYASLDETRESWRPSFYEMSRRIVADASNATEAAQALNRELFNEIGVHYNTGRKRPNQSPSESIAQGRATCTGLSIILVNACRSVGVPARIAGVASWHDKRGNHTWVEVWDGQRWRFTGADEYNKNGLDRAWFVGDASKAVAGSTEHAVWATSWAETGRHFPMVWNRADASVPGVDVTSRYARKPKADAALATLNVRLWDARGGARVVAGVRAFDASNKEVASGQTRAGTADLNDMPALSVPRNSNVTLSATVGNETRIVHVKPPSDGSATIDLHWNEMGLSRDDAEAAVRRAFRERATRIKSERAGEVEAKTISLGEHELRYKERVFGEAPANGRSLWISMHGGGGAPTEVNDRQWENQIRLYEPAEGIYIAPRAPTDTWNLWHRAHIDGLFDRLIETLVATRGVDPDRVYLMGYSAGGDGVYQLAPRMADRFAAAAMMAGHPNETKPDGLRNLPFMLFMGGDDAAYNRNGVARSWGEQLGALRDADPDGYPHRVTIYEGLGHWMQGRDKEALPWMAARTRDAWPRRIVWLQDNVTHTRFYWLGIDADQAKERTRIDARVDGQTISIESEHVAAVTLRLRDNLLDLDRPIEVRANGKVVFSGHAVRTLEAVEASLDERNDPASAATATLRVAW